MGKLRLAALDVDGTLMDSRKRLSPAVGRAVDALLDAGIEVCVATGRTLSELEPVLTRWPRIRYCILSNGACTVDRHSGVCIHAAQLSLQTAREVLGAAARFDLMAEIYADGTVYTEKRCWENAAQYHAAYLTETLPGSRVVVPDIGAFLRARKTDVEKIEISFRDGRDLLRMREACEGMSVSMAVSIHDGLEINSPDADKGSALAALCNYLGIAAVDAAALGDSETDIPMLRLVGLPIVMGSAGPAVRACAAVVVPDNDSDGAAIAIRAFMLKG